MDIARLFHSLKLDFPSLLSFSAVSLLALPPLLPQGCGGRPPSAGGEADRQQGPRRHSCACQHSAPAGERHRVCHMINESPLTLTLGKPCKSGHVRPF